MAGRDPTDWKAKGTEGIRRRSELEEQWFLARRAALHGRTELGTTARDCHMPLHTALLPLPPGDSGPFPPQTHPQAPQPGSRATPGRKQGLLSGSFYSTRKQQGPSPLPWPFPLSRMFFPRILMWSTPSPPSFSMDDTFPVREASLFSYHHLFFFFMCLMELHTFLFAHSTLLCISFMGTA